jgi:NitT/TauT family transport system substrate-binding protein
MKRVEISRRTLLKTSALVGAAAAIGFPSPAVTQTLKKVTLVYGVQTIESSGEGYFSSIPIALGLYRDEGLDVDIQTVGGASAALNLLANGQAQFSTHGVAGLFSGVGRGVAMKGFICQIPDYFVSIAVDQKGPIKKLEDLKGKTIGLPAIGGAPHLVTKAILRNMGWDPEKDVQFIAVGTSLPALDAMRRDRVQALVAWDTVFALWEFNGQAFTYFRPEPIPTIGFTHCTNTMDATIQKDPQMVAGMARAMAKAIIYQAAAPEEELTRMFYKVFPAAKPTGIPEAEAFRLDKLRQDARKKVMRLDKRVFSNAERLGDVTDQQIAVQRDLLASGGEIPEALPIPRYFTRQFLDQANDFDKAATLAKAKAYRA